MCAWGWLRTAGRLSALWQAATATSRTHTYHCCRCGLLGFAPRAAMLLAVGYHWQLRQLGSAQYSAWWGLVQLPPGAASEALRARQLYRFCCCASASVCGGRKGRLLNDGLMPRQASIPFCVVRGRLQIAPQLVLLEVTGANVDGGC